MSVKSSVSLYWRIFKNKYSLVGTECKICQKVFFPPMRYCNECSNQTTERPFVGKGTIESVTTIHSAPEGFEHLVPYHIGLVRLDEGPVISAQIVGSVDNSALNKKVRVVFRKTFVDKHAGIIHYGFKFEII